MMFLLVLGMISSSALALDALSTASLVHNGITYTYGPGNTSPTLVEVCDGDNFQLFLLDIINSSSQPEHSIFEVSPTNNCLNPVGNNGREIFNVMSGYNITSTITGSFAYDPTVGGPYQERYISIHEGVLSASDILEHEVGDCVSFTLFFKIRVYPSSSGVSATYTQTLDINNQPIGFTSQYLNTTGVTHTWSYALSSNPNTFIPLSQATNLTSFTMSQLGIWGGNALSNTCFLLKHTIANACFSVDYVEEVCNNSCEVNAEFDYDIVSWGPGGTTVTIQLNTDEDANNPSLSGFLGNWYVSANGNFYTVNSNGQVTIPADVNVNISYVVEGQTVQGYTYNHCFDEFSLDVIIKSLTPEDCRQVNLENHSTFVDHGNGNGFGGLYNLEYTPIVTYTGSNGPVGISTSHIVGLTINGVNTSLSGAFQGTIGGSSYYINPSILSHGDLVCITLSYMGCTDESCFTYEDPKVRECEELNLQSQTIFEYVPASPGIIPAIEITPLITVNGGAPMVQPSTSIIEVYVNGTMISPGVWTYLYGYNQPSLFLLTNTLNDGDIVCVVIQYQGCKVEDCYTYKIPNPEDTDCKKIGLQSFTTFDVVPSTPGVLSTVLVNPIVTVASSSTPVTLTGNSISEVKVDGVSIPLSSILTVNFNGQAVLNTSYMTDGDVVCVTINYMGCEIQDCFIYKGSSDSVDTDCKELNVQDLSYMTHHAANLPTSGAMLQITPKITYNGFAFPLEPGANIVYEITVNGNVVYPGGSAFDYSIVYTNPNSGYLDGSLYNSGDIVCFKFNFNGCEVEHCEKITYSSSRMAGPQNEVIEEKEVEVYNNSNGEVVVEGQGLIKEMSLYTIDGKQIWNQGNTVLENEYILKNLNFPKGIYFLKLNVNDKIVARKIILN